MSRTGLDAGRLAQWHGPGTAAMPPSHERLEQLFDKPYGQVAPTEDQWRAFYAEGVHFIDPTQEKQGLKAYLEAQEGLVKRCV